MNRDKLTKYFREKIGWSSVAILAIFAILLIYVVVKKKRLLKKSVYTTGISEGRKKEVRGSIYLHYVFTVDGKNYKGSVTTDFCDECTNKCCDSGSIVFVRYERNNPSNNDLVKEIPD